MTGIHGPRALRPVEPAPGVLVHTGADRRLAVEHWLLAGSRNRDRSRTEWRKQGVAMLPLGIRFCAVRLPGYLVHALAGTHVRKDVDALLGHALDDGPVICDPRYCRYYALVPASVPVTWREAVDDWRTADVDCLGRGSILGVPRVDASFNPEACASYWSVPVPSPGVLCAPLHVARFIAAARVCMHEEPEP